MAVDFNAIYDTLKNGVATLAKETITEYVSQATQDGEWILSQMKEELQQWYKDVLAGEMTADDVAFLLQGRKELLEMKALQQLGIAQVQIDKFKNGLVTLITSTISSVI